jgi:hypothetical protein
MCVRERERKKERDKLRGALTVCSAMLCSTRMM